MMKNVNEMAVVNKLMNLQSALAMCGIESELCMSTCDNTTFISLQSELWNCEDGSTVTFEVYAESTDDFATIDHYVQSGTPADFDNLLEEAGKIAKELE